MLYNDNLSKYNALFICTIIKICATKFDYSDAFTSDNLKNLKIPLPAKKNNNGSLYINKDLNYNDNGNVPDWDYMNDYMKDIEKKAQRRINILKEF